MLANDLSNNLANRLFNRLSGGDVAAPSNVNAGADDSFDMLSATPYTLSGSATGATSYLWSKVSGPGTVTFVDATDPATDCTFSADGSYVLRLTATNAGGSASDDVGITVTATLSALLSRMASGSRTNVWYEVGVSSETLNGSNFSQLNDVGSAGLHVVQGTAGNQPAKTTAGGPNGKDCITFQGTQRRLTKATAGITASRELFFIAVVKAAPTAANTLMTNCRDGAEAAGNSVFGPGCISNTNFFTVATPDTGTQELKTLTSPAIDSSWHVQSLRYATGLAPVAKIDNAAVSPLYTTSSGKANNVSSIVLGHATAAGGAQYSLGMFEAVTAAAGSACLSEEDAIRYYINKQTGL